MKRLTVFFILALTLAAMAALTSCGCDASVQDNGGNTGSTNNGTANDNTVPDNGTVMDDIIHGSEDIVGGVDDAIDDITGNTGSGSHDGGVTYGDMLEDGTVNDHDGLLGNEPTARRR